MTTETLLQKYAQIATKEGFQDLDVVLSDIGVGPGEFDELVSVLAALNLNVAQIRGETDAQGMMTVGVSNTLTIGLLLGKKYLQKDRQQ